MGIWVVLMRGAEYGELLTNEKGSLLTYIQVSGNLVTGYICIPTSGSSQESHGLTLA